MCGEMPRSGPPEAAPTGRLALSPGSTLRHQISALSRHYPDTPRDSDTYPTPVSIDTRSDTPTPVSGQCQAILTLDLIGQRQAVSMVSKQNRHSDTPTLQASMLTRGTHTQQRPAQDTLTCHSAIGWSDMSVSNKIAPGREVLRVGWQFQSYGVPYSIGCFRPSVISAYDTWF